MYHCAKFQSIWSTFKLDQICQEKQFLEALSQSIAKKHIKLLVSGGFSFFMCVLGGFS